MRVAYQQGIQYQGKNPYDLIYHESSLDTFFKRKQLQKKFKHAEDFEILGKYNIQNKELFLKKLMEHMKFNHARIWTYRNRKGIHYYNKKTDLNVMINPETNKFISTWKLSESQRQHMNQKLLYTMNFFKKQKESEIIFEEQSELEIKFFLLIDNFNCFNNSDYYIELIENFLNFNIDADTFQTNFYDMYRLDRDKEFKWETMEYIIDNLKLKQFQGFASILSKLFTDLDVFEPDPLFRDSYEIDEKELRHFTKEALSKLKTYSDS